VTLQARLKRWLLDKYARDEVVAFAREMLAEQVALNQRLMRENAELIVHKHDLYNRIRELKKQLARLEAE